MYAYEQVEQGDESLCSEISKYSFTAGQFQKTNCCRQGWRGDNTTQWRMLRLVLGDAYINSLLAEQQTADRNIKLIYVANLYKGGGRKMYPGIQRSSYFGKGLLALALFPSASESPLGLLSSP